ncbi:bifunctional [glutamine synthetase] adenylyltransferase/[glutamine synthetase]-adenylyl-L-tyrosine phosphorylase [Kiloniella sp. b19]|uniref:bifunctional [glutamine synthetase] adenylyltransferase/[glutamine synthetase]-adenylyl-L-tyrosine phosphorylase n=1 Tax=Kiloniella sp. GXU_MW_B19 TaxID=3141326 RepID=UPI0031DEC740
MTCGFSVSEQDLPKIPEEWQKLPSATHWLEHLDRLQEPELQSALKSRSETSPSRELIASALCHSPYLSQCMLRHTAFVHELLRDGPDKSLTSLCERLLEQTAFETSTPSVQEQLRHAKQQAALTIALADLSRDWDDCKIVKALSDFANTSIRAALRHLLLVQHNRGNLVLHNPGDPEDDCGYVILAMGKLGADELNYSSDIDLIVLFDPAKCDYRHDRGPQEGYVRITRDLVRLLNDRTKDGYVFRTDLRLRPDPGATPIALSYNAALSYYESLGLNWERAAMIKARPVAGDIELGKSFLSEIRPFVWRKHLDFAAIDDIHAIKRQINAHKGGHSIKLPGHNIKLGRGGIREVEFFAQTQQLIWGGRDQDLRSSRTVESLRALTDKGKITAEVCQDMERSYWFLRRLENRLQMIDDQQTQIMPETEEKLEAIAAFMGYASLPLFEEELLGHLQRVEYHYDRLFEEEQTAEPEQREESLPKLVFAGSDPTPQILEDLTGLGFEDPERAFGIVTNWKAGRHRAVRSNRSRNLINQLLPTLMIAFRNSGHPDQALLQFDTFLSTLPTGVQLFAMLQANPNLLDLLAEIMGTAPELARTLGQNPNLLEAVLTGSFFAPLPNKDFLRQSLQKALNEARDYQDILDITRRWTKDFKFQVGVQILRDTCDVPEGNRALSDLAEVILETLLPHVEQDFARRHGIVPGTSFAIVAMGKLGSREMTPTSDLDLICLYDRGQTEGFQQSDGDKPLDINQYFIRLTQRVINAITAMTPEGTLYEIDMRLRPSGTAGPLAISLEAFEEYQSSQAWTWEHMALTRARPIAGPEAFLEQIRTAVQNRLCSPRDNQKLQQDVLDMRKRLHQEKAPRGPLDCKAIPGGLTDLEFLAQFLQLLEAPGNGAILRKNTFAVFETAAELGLLSGEQGQQVALQLDQLQRLQRLLRLTSGGFSQPEELSEATRERALKIFGASTTDEMLQVIARNSTRIHTLFAERIGDYSTKDA